MVSDSSVVPSIERLAELQTFVTRFASIERMVNLTDSGRPENDVEHSYGLALTCWFLQPRIAPELDLAKVFAYALSHDVVEIHAGDTFAFAPEAELNSKSVREDTAIEQIAADWPDFPELADHAAGYKNKRDEEAKFVYAVDKLLPIFMINLGEKADYYARHKLTLEMEKSQKRDKILTSKHVAPYYDKLVAWMETSDYTYKEDTTKP